MKTICLVMISVLSLMIITEKTNGQWIQSTLPASNIVTDVLATNGITFVATSNNGLFRSQDFQNWSSSGSGITTTNIRQIISVIESSNIVLYVATDAGAFRSTMLGYSWVPVNSGLTNLDLSTIYSDGTVLYAGAQGTAFRSDDYGQNWSSIAIGSPTQLVNGFLKNNSDVLAGLTFPGDYLCRSQDNGITWMPYGTGLYEVNQLEKLNGELFAISGTVMYHSLDEGATWTLSSSGLVSGMYITDMMSGSDYLWVSTFAGGYVRHTDSAAFRMITQTMPMGGTNLTAVGMDNNWIIYGTLNNGVWYAPNVVTGLPPGPIPPSEFVVIPNPVKDNLTIASQHLRMIKRIEILNLAGSSFFSKDFQSSVSEFDLDVSLLPGGIYLIRISAGNEMVIKKFIKE